MHATYLAHYRWSGCMYLVVLSLDYPYWSSCTLVALGGGLAMYIVAAQTHLHLSLLLLTSRLLSLDICLSVVRKAGIWGQAPAREPRSGACPTRCYLLVSFSLYHFCIVCSSGSISRSPCRLPLFMNCHF